VKLPASPFKGLSYFGDSDHDRRFFFGRDRESEVVAANLMASRLTVLYGPSGVGKSSLLRAGVTRRLRSLVPAGGGDGGVEVAVVDSWRDDPIAAVRAAAGARDDVSLADALAERAIATGGELYLVLDQMEEYVLYHGRDGGPLGDELEEVLTRPDLPVHVLLGVRDDALAELDAFKRRLPGLFGNVLRLDHLTRAAARSAIEGPLLAYAVLGGPEVKADDDFVEAVLGEVTAGRIEQRLTGRGLVPTGGRTRRVEAPYLQLVLERVWDVERQQGSDRLRLATFRELGGAERIVEAHLERALTGLAASDLDTVARLFDHLVTPSGSKIAHSRDDLVRYGGADAQTLDAVLGSLAAERIVRPVPARNGGGPRYEIFHDVLAAAVLAWRVRHETARALAAERAAARRRQRRLALLALGALVALAVLAALTVYAFDLRAEANEQAALAEEQTQLALAAQAEAEANAAEAEANASEAEANAAEAEANAEEARRQQRAAAAATKRAKSAEAAALAERDAANAARNEAERQEGIANDARHTADAARAEAVTAAAEADTARADAERQADRATESQQAAERSADKAVAEERRAELAARREREARVAADERRRQAQAQALTSRALALVDRDPADALRVALEGAEIAHTEGLEVVLRDGLKTLQTSAILPGPDTAFAADWTADGTKAVVASSSGVASVYDARTGRRLRRVDHGGPINAGLVSGDGQTIVTAGRDGFARIWRAGDGMLLVTANHGGLIRDAALSPRGDLLATAGGQALRLWSLPEGRLVGAFRQPAAADGVVFSPDGGRVLVTARDARVYDTVTHGLLATLDAPGHINTAAFSPVSSAIVTAGRDDMATIWDALGTKLHELTGHGSDVTAVAWSPKGDLIATASIDNSARLWRTDNGQQVTLLSGHSNRLTGVSFSPDASSVAVSSLDGTGTIWTNSDFSRWTELVGHTASLTDVAFSPDSTRVLTASEDGSVRIWDANVDPVLTAIGSHGASARAVAFSPDGNVIATGGVDRTLRLTRPNGTVVRNIPQPSTVNDIAFSRDGRLLLVAGDEGAARLVGVDGELRAGFEHAAPVRAAAFVGSDRIATAGADGIARVWPRAGGRAPRELRHGSPLMAVAASADGKFLATGAEDASIRVWRVADGRLLRVLEDHETVVTGLAFSADGRRLASSSQDTDVRVWDTRTWTNRLLRGHTAIVGDVAISPDGRWIATAGPTTVGVWETETGRRIDAGAPFLFVRGHGPRVRSVAFAPDSRRIVSVGDDGTLRSYLCELCGTAEQLITLAQKRLGRLARFLTPEERRKYLGG
jgi:WD40 repeat protein